jgi:predicted ATP-dependent serine protease
MALGELSLTGTIKPAPSTHLFLKEAQKFGIKNVFVASGHKNSPAFDQCKQMKNVYQLLSLFDDETKK